MLREELSPLETFLDTYFYTTEMYSHFDLSIVATLGVVSKTTASLFSEDQQTIWRSFLLRFLTKKTERFYFEKIFPLNDKNFQFKKICQRMRSVSSLYIEPELKTFYFHPCNALPLILIAADVGGDNLINYLKQQELRIWLRLAIALHSNKSVMTLKDVLGKNISRVDIAGWAAVAKNKELIDTLVETGNDILSRLDEDFFEQLILSGNVEMARLALEDERFLEHNFSVDQQAMEAAALSGSLPMYFYLKSFLSEQEFFLMEATLVKAVMSGCLEMVKQVVADYPNAIDALDADEIQLLLRHAAKNKNVNLVKYLMDVLPEKVITQRVLEAAASSCSVEIFDLLYAEYTKSSGNDELLDKKYFLDSSAKSGDLKMVRYMRRKFGVIPDQDTLASATFRGSVVFRYLLHPFFRLRPSGSTIEAASGSLNLLLLYTLLDPAKGYNLVVRESMIGNIADYVMRPLLRANASMRTAFVCIVKDRKIRAKEKLEKAIDLSLTHFFDLIVDACLYPTVYAMTEENVKSLIEQVDKVLESISPSSTFSFIDLDAVYEIFAKASEHKLKELEVDAVFSGWLQKLQAVDKRLNCHSVSSFALGKK